MKTLIKRVVSVEEPFDNFQVGDIIEFALNNGEKVEAMAVKKENDGSLFIFVDCLSTEHSMNDERTNKGGYDASDLRVKLNKDILDLFPSDIRGRMIPFANGDYLRLPTEKEIFGENEYGEEEPDETQQFEPMKFRRNRIAFQGTNGDWEWYWLQNAVKNSAANFAIVNSNGNASSYGASASLGVRPCFKL